MKHYIDLDVSIKRTFIRVISEYHFKESRSVGAYLRTTPTQHASLEKQRQEKTSKCGSKELRSLLVETGVVVLTRSKKWNKLKS